MLPFSFLLPRQIEHNRSDAERGGEEKRGPADCASVLVLGGVVLRRHDKTSALSSSPVNYLHDVDHLRTRDRRERGAAAAIIIRERYCCGLTPCALPCEPRQKDGK